MSPHAVESERRVTGSAPSSVRSTRIGRRWTRVVPVGDVGVGGREPVRIQSMITASPVETKLSAMQIEALARAGCEIVRVTVPSIRDAEALGPLRKELERSRLRVPLVADVHFTPNAAMVALEHVEKLRVNPGNFADKKRFAVREYTDAEYRNAVERAAERFRPIVRRAKELGRSLRIGANHGSLSDRILNRFGDTTFGMVESAIEFLDVCEDESFHDVVFSMKASNPRVAIEAYRALVTRLDSRPSPRGYPIHLGVTEAGEGLDARVKSAIGIASLLDEGIGDTVRVSLTEDPVEEVPVARAIVDRFARPLIGVFDGRQAPPSFGPRTSHAPKPTGTVLVDADIGALEPDAKGLAIALQRECWRAQGRSFEGLVFDLADESMLSCVSELDEALRARRIDVPIMLRTSPLLALTALRRGYGVIVRVNSSTPGSRLHAVAREAASRGLSVEWSLAPEVDVASGMERILEVTGSSGTGAVRVSADGGDFVERYRAIAAFLNRSKVEAIIALRHPGVNEAAEKDAALVATAGELGGLLVDGVGEIVSIGAGGSWRDALSLSFRILQGARVRMTQAEFVSCPSCGRTQFDLPKVTARIRARTEHLRDVSIAIMGCIVNGPGEMADADFGYVGSGPGQVDLFVGKELVERHLSEDQAEERLVELIKQHGRWSEPPNDPKRPVDEFSS